MCMAAKNHEKRGFLQSHILEHFAKENAELREEVQRLQDENARLKWENCRVFHVVIHHAFLFGEFESGENKGKSPLEIANVTMPAKSVFGLLRIEAEKTGGISSCNAILRSVC